MGYRIGGTRGLVIGWGTFILKNAPVSCIEPVVHWDDPEGWNEEWGGRRVQDGEHMYTCGGFILIFGKTNTINKV